MSVFLLTSQRNAMRALASQGIFATDCHAQVCSIIAQHLSPSTIPANSASTGTPA